MDRATILDAVDLESSRFLVAVSSGSVSLEAPVVSCPEWDVSELVGHLGTIYCRVALIASSRLTKAPDRNDLPAPPDGEARVGWFAEQRAAMLAALEDIDDETPVWNWTDDSPGSPLFWGRRMAHETLVHRVDAELSQERPPAQAMPDVAADTVSEFLELFLPRFEQTLRETAPGTIHLHATDVAGAEWTLTPRASGPVVSRDHAKADVALRGTAFELACWIWGRLPAERLETFGDPSVARRFQEIARV
jgi:uncharacterized protein (TIGR03083 family)